MRTGSFATPGGEVYPSATSSVEMTAANIVPVGLATDPPMPMSGVSARRTHGAPMNRIRASANRATTSGSPRSGAARVTRMLCTSRRFGVPMVASGTRMGIR